MSWNPFSSANRQAVSHFVTGRITDRVAAKKAVEFGQVDDKDAQLNYNTDSYRNPYGKYVSLSKSTTLETIVFWAVVIIFVNLLIFMLVPSLPRLPDWIVLGSGGAAVYILWTTIMEPRGVLQGYWKGLFWSPSPEKREQIKQKKIEDKAVKVEAARAKKAGPMGPQRPNGTFGARRGARRRYGGSRRR